LLIGNYKKLFQNKLILFVELKVDILNKMTIKVVSNEKVILDKDDYYQLKTNESKR
jgi:hypothetical protein